MIKYFSQTRVINMEQTQNGFEIVKHSIIYYEVSVNVRNDGTRTTITHPVDIDEDGVEQRHVSDGTTIIACVPATYDVYAVYMIDANDSKVFIGYDLPGIDMDWQYEAHKCAEMYGDYED